MTRRLFSLWRRFSSSAAPDGPMAETRDAPDAPVAKALIVAQPWIDLILDGSKTWEMRSRAVAFRGWFGLIGKGTGAVQGIARLVDVGAPLTPEEMLATIDRHRIPAETIRSGAVARWTVPWVLADARRLAEPVPYTHPSGAVTWVDLDDTVSRAIAAQCGAPAEMPASADTTMVDTQVGRAPPATPLAPPVSDNPERTPAIMEADTSNSLKNGRFIGETELTQANIDYNHIYLRTFFDRFPDDAIGGSNRSERAARDLFVDWGGGEDVETDLDGKKMFFRSRGWVGRFFQQTGARPGDRVRVEEAAPYRYRVRLVRADGGAR